MSKQSVNRGAKGIALLWTMLLSFVLLVIASAMVSFIIKESRMTVDIQESTQAYSNAKAGIGWAQLFLKNNPGVDLTATSKNVSINLDTGGTTASSASIVISGNSCNYTVQSTGNFQGITRKIVYNQNCPTYTGITSSSGTIGPATGSFTMQFDFWNSTGAAAAGGIGLSDGTAGPTNYIALTIDSAGKASAQAKSNGTVIASQPIVDALGNQVIINQVPSTDDSSSYTYRATIKYIKGIGAWVNIYQRAIVGTNAVYNGAGTTQSPLDFTTSGNFSNNLNKLYSPYAFSADSNITPATAYDGDGSFMQSGPIRFDNVNIALN